MLSANEAVSKALKENSTPSLYRVHEKISDENLVALKKFLQVLGIKINISDAPGKAIQEILKKVSGKPYEQVVNLVVLKSMMSAFYGPVPLGHFGLGFGSKIFPMIIIRSKKRRSRPPHIASGSS